MIRERGPITVAAFMELALYDPQFGYYARAARRSGRAGDFFTSVDVGPLFGELLEIQLAEMARLLCGESRIPNPESRFDLVEAGAGSGRLSADILRAAKTRDHAFYDSIRLHLVEASAAARAAQRETLGDLCERLTASTGALPPSFEGALIANELLDALPAHQVVMRDDGLREVYVDVGRPFQGDVGRPFQGRRIHDAGQADGDPEKVALHLIEGPLSTPELQAYLDRLDVTLEPGWRAEINLRAVEWVRDAARRLARGFMILIDYGHDAEELYSPSHSLGTLTSYASHRAAGADSSAPAWLQRPGEQDITAHVDFTSVRAAAESEGMTTIGFLDQTYFLLGLLQHHGNPQSAINPQLKTLISPGGLGSTQKVLLLGKGVGSPPLGGLSFKVRVT